MKRLFFVVLASLIFCFRQYAFGQETLNSKNRRINISEGIQIVLKNNRLIKTILPNDRIAYQETLISRSALLPRLSASISQTFNRHQPATKFGATTVYTGDKDPYAYGFDVYQTLFDFGKNLSNYRASKELFKAEKAHTESVKRVVVLEFLIAYFDLLEADKMITVSEREFDSLSGYLKDIQLLYEQGTVVKNDLLPAKVRLADVKQRLIAARNGRQIAAARLKNMLGFSLRDNITADDVKTEVFRLPRIEEAWGLAKEKRPEIVFYDDQIQAAFLSARAKAVENFPEIYAQAGYDYAKNRYVVHENNSSIVLGAKMDLYDGGKNRADIFKERIKQEQLGQEKDKLIEDIKLEIEDSYYNLKNAMEKVFVAGQALKQAEENVRFYRVKYNAGSATPTEVLDAIALETKAQTNYYNDGYEAKRGYAQLMYSMGMDLGLVYKRMEGNKNGPGK